MVEKIFQAEITYKVKESHPDIKYIENPKKELSYIDTYTLDLNKFDDTEHMKNFIKNDLKLVASGGYSTDQIENVRFNIKRVS